MMRQMGIKRIFFHTVQLNPPVKFFSAGRRKHPYAHYKIKKSHRQDETFFIFCSGNLLYKSFSSMGVRMEDIIIKRMTEVK